MSYITEETKALSKAISALSAKLNERLDNSSQWSKEHVAIALEVQKALLDLRILLSDLY